MVGMATAMMVPSKATSKVVRQRETKIRVSRRPVGYCFSSSSLDVESWASSDCFLVASNDFSDLSFSVTRSFACVMTNPWSREDMMCLDDSCMRDECGEVD